MEIDRLHEEVRRLRAMTGRRPSELARQLGIPKQTYHSYEADPVAEPTTARRCPFSVLARLAQIAGQRLVIEVVPADEPPPSPPALTLARLYDSLPEPDRAAVERVAATLPQLPDEIRTTVRDGLIEEMDRWLRRHGRAEKAG